MSVMRWACLRSALQYIFLKEKINPLTSFCHSISRKKGLKENLNTLLHAKISYQESEGSPSTKASDKAVYVQEDSEATTCPGNSQKIQSTRCISQRLKQNKCSKGTCWIIEVRQGVGRKEGRRKLNFNFLLLTHPKWSIQFPNRKDWFLRSY